jgi:hypothetical protein
MIKLLRRMTTRPRILAIATGTAVCTLESKISDGAPVGLFPFVLRQEGRIESELTDFTILNGFKHAENLNLKSERSDETRNLSKQAINSLP